MKKTFRSLTSLLLSSALALSLTACGQPDPDPSTEASVPQTTAAVPEMPATAPQVPTTIPATQPAPTELPTEAESVIYDQSLSLVRDRLEPSGAILGIFYLGCHEGEFLDNSFYAMLDDQGLLEQYPFIAQIPAASYARTAGSEVYLIVPADPESVVEVTEWDETTGEPHSGEVLYYSQTGDPFFVQGNVSDIMPNLSITLSNRYGHTLANYHPYLSLRVGMVATETGDDQIFVMDLTQYGTDSSVYFEIYFPNEAFDGLSHVSASADRPDESLVVELLVEQRAIPDTVLMISFRCEEGGIYLDLTQDFADYLGTLSAAGESLVMRSVANTFLSAFQADYLYLTVEGTVLETANAVYSDPLLFT